MNANHTPGPWDKIDGLMRYIPFSVVADNPGGPGRLSIAHVDDVDGFAGSSEANARLIAAAPELLEACKASVAEITGGSLFPESLRPGNETPLELLKAAIAKAEEGHSC